MTAFLRITKRWKKALKYSLLTTGSIILLLFSVIAFVLNFIVTPAKFTPLVLGEARKYLNAEIECESIDLTFFSTFPEFGVRLNKGAISTQQDTLLSFESTLLTVRPLAFLLHNNIHIGKISFDNATIYASINEQGNANWDIVKPISSTDDSSERKNDSIGTAPLPSVEIGKIEINNANITFDDRSSALFTDLRNVNFSLKGSLSEKRSELQLHLDTRNILVWQEGKLLLNKMGFIADTRILADRENHHYTLDKTVFEINGIKIGAQGDFQGDTLTNTLGMNLHFGLQVPSLETVLKLIPASIVKEATDVKADGKVTLTGSLKGNYGKETMPVLSFQTEIENGKFHYAGMPYGVDQLDLDLNANIDLMQKNNSRITLNSFHFKGASSEISAKASIENPLTDPRITSDVKTNINFTELSNTFPLQEGVLFGGNLTTELHSKIRISDLKREDWGRLDLNGYLKTEDLFLVHPADTFDLRIKQAGCTFGANVKDETSLQGSNLLNGIVGFDGLDLQLKQLKAHMGKTALHLKTSPLKDTTAIATIQGTLGYSELNIEMADTIRFRSGAAKTTLRLAPSAVDPKTPVIYSDLKFDSLFVTAGSHTASLRQAGFVLESIKNKNLAKHWISTGSIGFASLELFSPLFPLPISMPVSKITLEEDRFVLNRAAIKIGDSDLMLSGKLENLKETFFHAGTLMGKMEVNSRFIDCNQLMDALAAQPASHEQQTDDQQVKTSSDSASVFIVPDKIDFVLSTDIKKVKFGTMEIENILGDMTIRNQSIELADLKLHTMAADMITTLVYKAKDNKSAYTGFDLTMKDIQVGKLVDFIPALDTLVPMLRSLDGMVNFRIAAETKLGADLMPVIPSIQAAAKVRGDSLVLMDGETFSEISKMLRFKNKNRNVIDSVSVDLLVRNGQIEIYPFLIGMDRYLAAVGGKHNIDMTFDYHISLLDSPIPFKVGVDVKGNMDDFKFKITKPKFKDLRKSARTSPVDSTGLSVRERIRRTLQERGTP